MNEQYKQTQAEQARKWAYAFRVEHPNLIRETTIQLQEGENLLYSEVPVFADGNVGLQRELGRGGNMKVTTGNILIYKHTNEDDSEWRDYTPIFPNLSTDDAFTKDEKDVGERFALLGPADENLIE